MNGSVHVLPVADLIDHDGESLDCWCQPTYREVCECENGCYKCRHGVTRIDRDRAGELSALGVKVIVVHNSADGRELNERDYDTR